MTSQPDFIRRVKIVATIGPASSQEDVLLSMIGAGMNVARINSSHGSQLDHAESIRRVRWAAEQTGRPIAILQDLQGVKIRTGPLAAGRAELREGNPFILTVRHVPGDDQSVFVSWSTLPQDVYVGEPLLLDDGRLRLRVTRVDGPDIHTLVEHGGTLMPHKGINLPGTSLTAPSLTEKDILDLKFGLDQNVDAMAISFVRKPEDVLRLREAIRGHCPEKAAMPIIAKLERREALDQLDRILEVSDGVMVARGDLGVETSLQDVPIIQKQIIQAANRQSKLVITATQMLESMIVNPYPTRAEASDVANAVFDGTDAVMLSGETAVGAYPVETVTMMASILQEAETHLSEYGRWQGYASGGLLDPATALAHAAADLANDRKVAAIAVFTHMGRSARLMSKARPCAPILAFTPSPETYRRLSMLWGVIPALVPAASTVEGMVAHVEAALLSSAPIRPGEQVVLVASLPMALQGPPNFLLLHTVGEAQQ
jgi:pyruvate kinase